MAIACSLEKIGNDVDGSNGNVALMDLYTLSAVHTMAVGQEEKEFQQFDWWKAKVCPLVGLHIGGCRPKENTLQYAYMVVLFESFGAKSFSSLPRACAIRKMEIQTMVERRNYGTKSFSAKNMGSLGDGLSFGRPPYEPPLRVRNERSSSLTNM
jgi:hypothetical protein